MVWGVAPYVLAHRPRARARWWVARADEGRVVLALDETSATPVAQGVCGVAAPLSLPDEFLAYLSGRGLTPRSVTLNRLMHLARAFAYQRAHGQKHPRRHGAESMSVLDRRQLPLYYAAMDLEGGVEVDVPHFLRGLELPDAKLSGALPGAVEKRAAILAGLRRRCGIVVDGAQRDLAIASFHALRAVVALAAAASRP